MPLFSTNSLVSVVVMTQGGVRNIKNGNREPVSFCVFGNCRCVLMNYMTGEMKLKAAVCVYKIAATNYRYL